MDVTVLNKTDDPERLICRAARGDMYEGYIGDTSYQELMESVEHSDQDEEADAVHNVADAKTRAFIRKQASRGHWGIWEHPTITFAIENMSRVTMAQITRHRHLTFDIQSMRYVDFEDPPVATPESLTNPDHVTRADGLVWHDGDDVDTGSMESAHTLYERAIENSVTAYHALLDAGVPAEDARYALPLGTQVNVTMSGNARTMLHVLNLRQRGNAQWEIRNLSEQLVQELEEWIPHTAEWWEEKGPVQISP